MLSRNIKLHIKRKYTLINFIRNIFRNVRLRLSNLAKEKKIVSEYCCIFADFSMNFHYFLFSLTFWINIHFSSSRFFLTNENPGVIREFTLKLIRPDKARPDFGMWSLKRKAVDNLFSNLQQLRIPLRDFFKLVLVCNDKGPG